MHFIFVKFTLFTKKIQKNKEITIILEQHSCLTSINNLNVNKLSIIKI